MDQTSSSPVSARTSFDFNKFIARVKYVLMTPVEAWNTIKAESTTVKELYVDYLIPLALITPLCAIVKRVLFGPPQIPIANIVIPSSVADTIGQQVVGFGMMLVLMFVFMHIMAAIAPKFQGSSDPVQCLKLIAYSGTPSAAVALLMFIPYIGSLAALVGALFGIYLFWIGIPVLLGIAPERRVPFVCVTIVANFIAGMLVSMVVRGILG